MATPIADSMVDNSAKDNTGDTVNGSEVDANPNTLAKILDGTTQTDLGGAGTVYSRALAARSIAAAAASVTDVMFLEWDPASGTPADGMGVGLRVTLPDDSTPNDQIEVASIDFVATDVSDATMDCRIDVSAIVAGTLGTVLEFGYDASGNVVNVIQTREAIAAAVRDGLIVEWDPDGAGNGTDGSTGIAIAFRMPDDADAQDIFARITALMSDDTATSEDCTLRFGVITAGTLANELELTGAALNPVTNDGLALGTTALGFSDFHIATGGVINWANGEVTITETDANTLTIAGVATRVDLAAGILELNNAAEWDTGVAVVAGEYSIGRDADATNQLHFNVPTGATYEWSVNDVAEMLLSATALTPGTDASIDLGTTTVRFGNVYTDSIGDTGQALTLVNAVVATGFDLNGIKMIVDADADTSITADTDDTVDIEIGGFDAVKITGATAASTAFNVISAGTANQSELYLKAAASGTHNYSAVVHFAEGSYNGTANNMGYILGYDAGNNYLKLTSRDIDGSATLADIWRVPDGQTTIDANTTWDANIFDWVCDACGWHTANEVHLCPKCGGRVDWHDDNALIDEALHAMDKRKAVELLEKLGVINTYGTARATKPDIFLCLQPAHQFQMSALAQLHNRVKKLERMVT